MQDCASNIAQFYHPHHLAVFFSGFGRFCVVFPGFSSFLFAELAYSGWFSSGGVSLCCCGVVSLAIFFKAAA
jgi:hypothetical protein